LALLRDSIAIRVQPTWPDFVLAQLPCDLLDRDINLVWPEPLDAGGLFARFEICDGWHEPDTVE
jgi:hypothetical protein